MTKLVFKGEPLSTNHVWKHSCRNGYLHSYMTPAGAALKEAYEWQAKAQWKQAILLGDVELEVTLYFGNRRKRDPDNQLKLLFDSMNRIVYADDSCITKFTVYKAYDKAHPRVEVSVAETIGK